MYQISTSKLLSELGVSSLNVIKSPKTGKLFASDDDRTVVLRVEQKINPKKKMVFLYTEEISDGCLINQGTSKNIVFTIK